MSNKFIILSIIRTPNLLSELSKLYLRQRYIFVSCTSYAKSNKKIYIRNKHDRSRLGLFICYIVTATIKSVINYSVAKPVTFFFGADTADYLVTLQHISNSDNVALIRCKCTRIRARDGILIETTTARNGGLTWRKKHSGYLKYVVGRFRSNPLLGLACNHLES